mmetsp:Transcript_28102/g.57509  ORF Transcript_28102/g.57509 Transcript_28102/m.57509 type:complete len:153 (-) Transcript_28102:90-548(-)
MIAREELKRMAERPGFNEDGTPVKLTKSKKAALIADRVIVRGVLGNTVGRVGRVAGRLLLGKIPETAKSGSFQEEKLLEEKVSETAQTIEIENNVVEEPRTIDAVSENDKADLEGEIFDQVFANGKSAPSDEDKSSEREWKVETAEKQLSTV